MQRVLSTANMHRAWVTATCSDYEGRPSIDYQLLVQADVSSQEQMGVHNLSNGECFDTYTMAPPGGCGEMSLNGAAAFIRQPGDSIIITTHVLLGEEEMANHQPRVVLVDESNKPR